MNPRSEPVLVPGARDVRATLDSISEDVAANASDADSDTNADTGTGIDTDTGAIVVACPPHPQYGGARSDSRLTAVSAALGERGISCLRFDYGPWDGGDGERVDTRNALRWATERYRWVGLFGYSFGATTALLAAGEASEENAPEVPRTVSVLAPDRGDFGAVPDADATSHDHDGDDDTSNTDRDGDRNAVGALDSIACPTQIIYGERDTTVSWEPVVARARERAFAVTSLPADHFFVGQSEKIATRVASFLADESQRTKTY